MQNKSMIAGVIVIIILISLGIYMFSSPDSKTEVNNDSAMENASTTPDQTAEQKEGEQVVIGKSVEGNDILAYNFGSGDTQLLFIGGIHGGYSWNTALLGFETVDYLKAHPEIIPADVTITVIPVLNPDGLEDVVGTTGKFSASDVSSSQSVVVAGRTNANKVDLSRNFDCNWKTDAVWQNKPISGGTSVFSEPESKALKSYVETHKVSGAVVWYSAAGGVYASTCSDAIMPETTTLTNAFAKASGYAAHTSYDYYPTSGDAVNWLAKVEIPAISVLLTNHSDTELTKNIKGLEAVTELYSKE